MIKITITTETGMVFWNQKEIKSRPLEVAKSDIYNELIRTGSQIKGITVVCDGALEAKFNFDDDSWADNEVNYQKNIEKIREGVVKEVIPTFATELEEYNYNVERTKVSRLSAYKKQTDPLLAEAQIKRVMGKDAEAGALEAEAVVLREAIQAQLPYPIENIA